jgi:hypothetical protein
MALGVKGKWKQHKDGGKDYPGQPETAHMGGSHKVMRTPADAGSNFQVNLRLKASFSTHSVRAGSHCGRLRIMVWLGYTVLGGSMHKLGLLVLLVAMQVSTADPRIGSWILTSAQSTLDPPNKLSITSLHDAVHVVISGETHVDFTAKWNGHEASIQGNPAFNQIELRRIGKHQVEVKEKKDGAVVATVRDKLSSDGNELTSTTSQNGRADRIAVWTRSGGEKAADNLFAGEWTQDLSKTRLRQGLVLKIEADGKDGVRFSGDFSYSARFDGREYDLKNSNNDTVTLHLVDAHTVDSVYRRDDQIVQKDRWVVSADGAQMTVTTTGTLETGQEIKETLVFRKQ